MENIPNNLSSDLQMNTNTPGKLPDIVCACGLSLNNFDVGEKKVCCKSLIPPETPQPILPVEVVVDTGAFYIEKKIALAARVGNQCAVDVNKVCKKYGGPGGMKVLDQFSMKIPAGAIYTLLGSSGSGKTTILQCVVGLKRIDSGSIRVLGVPTTNEEQFLKIRQQIGYMPQDLALYDHLRTKEILKFYGNLYGLTEEEFIERWSTLRKLLDLSSNRYKQIKDLSGGTKRRVSLALALLNKPKLLILDEPTAGMDPLLRRGIWEHLFELIKNKQTTICITTHFVEETKFSNVIGFMRNGRLIIEDSPQSLLSTCKSNLLQDAILKVCKNDEILSKKTNYNKNQLNSSVNRGSFLNEVVFEYNGRTNLRSSADMPDEKSFTDKVSFRGFKLGNSDVARYENLNGQGGGNGNESRGKFIHDAYKERRSFGDLKRLRETKDSIEKCFGRVLSFATVMWIYLLRQPIFAFILVFLPAIQLFMTFFVVGKEPLNLKVAVINHEALDFSQRVGYDVCQNASLSSEVNECDLTFLSCHIQNDLSSSPKLDLISESDRETAEWLIQQGSLQGYIYFPQNYSENLVNRFITGKFASDDDTLEGSRLRVTLEKSHYLAYHMILKEVLDSLDNLSKSIDKSCGFDGSFNDIPIYFRKPVFGKLDGTHQDSIIPAIVAQILFEIMYGIAPMIVIKELKEGTFVRSNLAGLKFSEFIIGIFVTMAPILLIQSISCYVVLNFGFGFEVKGSFLLFVILCLLAGLCGQGFGIFMGILVKSEFSVIVSAIMVVPIIMTCSGTLWPLESHPYYLTIIYYIFPSALIVSSLRSVINRGVGLTHALVWPGLVNTISWSVAFWLLSIYGFRRIAKA